MLNSFEIAVVFSITAVVTNRGLPLLSPGNERIVFISTALSGACMICASVRLVRASIESMNYLRKELE